MTPWRPPTPRGGPERLRDRSGVTSCRAAAEDRAGGTPRRITLDTSGDECYM